MLKIAIGFNKDDGEIESLIRDSFSNVKIVQSRGFDGWDIFFIAIIPVLRLSVEVVDRIVAILSSNPKSVLILKDEIISIENYSAKGVREILEARYTKNLDDD